MTLQLSQKTWLVGTASSLTYCQSISAAGLVDGQLYGGQARVQLGTEIVVVAADHLDVPSGAEVADLERLIDQLRQPVVESEDSVGDAVLIE